MEPRTKRALHFLAGTGLIISAFIPTGRIETPWPPYTLQAWAWMEPFVWPFFVLGLLFIGAARWESVRRKIPAAAVLLGVISIILFLGTLVEGCKALYDLWFPDQLGPAGMLEFHLWILAVHFSVMLALAFGGLVAIARRWHVAQKDRLAPPG